MLRDHSIVSNNGFTSTCKCRACMCMCICQYIFGKWEIYEIVFPVEFSDINILIFNLNSKENNFVFGNVCCGLTFLGVYFKILGSESSSQMCDDPVDTSKPLDILEEEELERISGLLQRDNLVRGLGIVEHVYRLLHCTPGTMGVLKTDTRSLPPPLVSKT